MRKLLTLTFLSLGGIVIMYGIRQLYLLYNIKFKVKNVDIKNVSLNSVNIILYVAIGNKSDISANITGQHYSILLNGVLISTLENKDMVHINSNGKTLIPINVNFSPSKIIGNINLLDIMKNTLSIKGFFSVKIGAIDLNNYPIDLTYTLQELVDISKQPKNVEDDDDL